jgi:hypothetical protein
MLWNLRLSPISPDQFEHCFIYSSLLSLDSVDLPTSQCIFHFYFKLTSFDFDVLCPFQPSIKMHTQVFHFVLLW